MEGDNDLVERSYIHINACTTHVLLKMRLKRQNSDTLKNHRQEQYVKSTRRYSP